MIELNHQEREREEKEMDKMERLAEILFQEDEYHYNKGEELIYHTKEDFEKEKEERDAAAGLNKI